MTNFEKMWVLVFVSIATDHTSSDYAAGVRLAFMLIAGVGFILSGEKNQ